MSNFIECESIFDLSNFSAANRFSSHCLRLKTNGATIIRLHGNDIDNMSIDCDISVIRNWHEGVCRIFDLPISEKRKLGKYRVEKGVHVGYREENGREFFETHLTSDNKINPDPNIENYDQVVLSLFTQLFKITEILLEQIAIMLGLDSSFFINLTDKCQMKKDELSSTLLRICSYPGSATADSSIVFGAHTDTSLLTIAPLASVPGLECLDPMTGKWWCPESQILLDPEYGRAGFVVVMVGEMLQLLTGGIFRAAVHRVRSPTDGRCRVSCPLLVRGHGKAVVEDAGEAFPQLGGLKMSLLHALLDRKRKKTAAENADKGEDWILSAWPVECVATIALPADALL